MAIAALLIFSINSQYTDTKDPILINHNPRSELRVPDQVELLHGPHRLLHRVLQRGAPLHADHDRDREAADPGPAEGSENTDVAWGW